MENASVTLQPLPFGITQTLMTAADGGVTFPGVPDGCYTVFVQDGELRWYYGGKTVAGDAKTFAVSGADVDLQNLQLPAKFSVSGNLTFSSGSASGATINFQNETGTNLFQRTLTGPFPGYSVADVPPGTYRLQFVATFFSSEYYDTSDAHSVLDATPVVVSNANVTGINVQLDAVPSVTGKVNGPGGPVSGARVGLFRNGSSNSSNLASSAADGSFTIANNGVFFPGDWVQIGVVPQTNAFYRGFTGTPSGSFFGYGDSFELTPGSNAKDVDVDATFSVSGHVEDADGNPAANVSVQAQDTTSQTFRGQGLPFTTTNGSGDYVLPGFPPGRFHLSGGPTASDAAYRLAAKTNLRDVSGNLMNVDITLPFGAKLMGSITDPNGDPVAQPQITVYAADCLSILSNTLGNASGAYTTFNFPAGMVKVFFSTPVQDDLGEAWFGGGTSCQTAGVLNAPVKTTTTADRQVPAATPGTGHTVFGMITNASTGDGLGTASVQLTNTAALTSYFGFSSSCGDFTIPEVPNGTYDVTVAKSGFRTYVSGQVTVSGADAEKNVPLVPVTGAIRGKVQATGGGPVMGASVCTVSPARCASSDQSGNYLINQLDTGTYKVVARTAALFEPRLYNNKATLATADNVSVTNGSTTSNINISLPAVAADPQEPDATGTPQVLARPELANAPARLLPNVPLNRAFRDIEDVDWFRITHTAGMNYRVTVTGGGFTVYGVFFTAYDGTTKEQDPSATLALQLAGGWTAPNTGEKWIGISTALSGSYTISLTESGGGPPTPTVTGINPTSGPAGGGTSVTITGTNFAANATVKIGGQNATNVVRVNATTITCKTPALTGGTLNDVVVDNPGSAVVVGPLTPLVSGTLTKGWFADFLDVPQAFLYHNAIEKILRAGITTGCGGGNYCANLPITRDAMAVFILRGEHGGAYSPPAATGGVFTDVTTSTFLAKWIEQFGHEGITTGCGGGNYCPTDSVTRDGMAVFLERGKNGAAFNPPAATGMVFCDVEMATFLSKWMEQLKADNITQGCSTGPCARLGGGTTPNYCPTGTVTRGEMAPFIVRAFGL